MRVIIKSEGHFENIYWIEVRKQKELSIVGWCGGEFLDQFLEIPTTLEVHTHFTYPESGDFHRTYRLISGADEQYLNIYTDRINIKRIIKKRFN